MTAHPLLLKGFEVELFTGRSNGANVGVAPDVANDLPGFVTCLLYTSDAADE